MQLTRLQTSNSLAQMPMPEPPVPVAEKLVHHNHERLPDAPECIYNVVYTGRSTLKAADAQDNTVQIEVNLDAVRKLYPTLNTFEGDVMKIIGQQLIEGIRVDRTGRLLIDNKKINPEFLVVR